MTRARRGEAATRVVRLAAAGLLALGLAGCSVPNGADPTTTVTVTSGGSDGGGSDGGGSDGGGSEASPATSSTISDDLGTLTGAGRPLGESTLEESLPGPDEVQQGWVDDPTATVGEVEAAQVSPGACAPLIQKGPGWDEVQATQRARVQANYAAPDNPPPPGTERHHLGVWAYSFDDPYPVALFDEAGAAVGECEEFTVTQADTGNSSEYEATSLAFPNLGDRTLALRLTIGQSLETVTIDFVVVKVGHNTFAVANTSYNGEPDTDRTERTARAVLTNLQDES